MVHGLGLLEICICGGLGTLEISSYAQGHVTNYVQMYNKREEDEVEGEEAHEHEDDEDDDGDDNDDVHVDDDDADDDHGDGGVVVMLPVKLLAQRKMSFLLCGSREKRGIGADVMKTIIILSCTIA